MWDFISQKSIGAKVCQLDEAAAIGGPEDNILQNCICWDIPSGASVCPSSEAASQKVGMSEAVRFTVEVLLSKYYALGLSSRNGAARAALLFIIDSHSDCYQLRIIGMESLGSIRNIDNLPRIERRHYMPKSSSRTG
jgi:hypothetical protein